MEDKRTSCCRWFFCNDKKIIRIIIKVQSYFFSPLEFDLASISPASMMSLNLSILAWSSGATSFAVTFL